MLLVRCSVTYFQLIMTAHCPQTVQPEPKDFVGHTFFLFVKGEITSLSGTIAFPPLKQFLCCSHMPLCSLRKEYRTKERNNKVGQGVRCPLVLILTPRSLLWKLGMQAVRAMNFHVIMFSCHESHFEIKQYCSENGVLSLEMKANEDLEPLQVVLSVLIWVLKFHLQT